ncbi:MAG: beta-lactamase family protein [Clostridia bacterium]|nr:beta-lactamase family protein [Clostridia bacterium]
MNMQKMLDALLEEGLREGCYPGAVAACGNAEQVFAISCAGKISQNGPDVNEATRYDMASLSKIIGPTMLALRAIEDGNLTLWDRLERFFPDCPQEKKGITIRHLMTHTAGFAPAFWLSEEAASPEDALRVLLEHPLETPVGAEVHYSCMGYITLGKILESIYGKPLDVLARERVFEPLGMKNTCYCPENRENIAATEVDKETGIAWQGIVHDENARFLGGVSANAGVFSDIGDMIKLAQMLARGGDGYLSCAMLKKARTCQAASADARRGLGFHLAGTPENFMGDLLPEDSFGHTGFTGTSLAIDPNTGFFVILLSNRVHPTRESFSLFRFRRRMHNMLYAAYTKNGYFEK